MKSFILSDILDHWTVVEKFINLSCMSGQRSKKEKS